MLRFEASAFNLFNSSIVTDRYNLYSHTIDGAIQVPNAYREHLLPGRGRC